MRLVEEREWYGMRLELRVRWWMQPYLFTLALLCALFQCEPDWEKVLRFTLRWGFVATVNGKRIPLLEPGE